MTTDKITETELGELERRCAQVIHSAPSTGRRHATIAPELLLALIATARRSAALEAEVEGLARGWKQRARLMETWGELEAENQAIAMAGCGEELTNALRQIKERP